MVKKSCWRFVFVVFLFLSVVRSGFSHGQRPEPCVADLVTDTMPALNHKSSVIALPGNFQEGASTLHLSLPRYYRWADGSQNAKTINAPETACWLSVCRQSNCESLLVARTSHLSLDVPRANRQKPTPSLFMLLSSYLRSGSFLFSVPASGFAHFLPIGHRHTGHDFLAASNRDFFLHGPDNRRDWLTIPDPEWPTPPVLEETGQEDSKPQPVEINLSTEKQPLFLIQNPVDDELYWLYWDERKQLQLSPWPFTNPTTYTDITLNPNDITLGISNHLRITEPSLLQVPVRLERLDPENRTFQPLLPLMELIFGDVIHIEKDDGNTEYWFRDSEGNVWKISRDELLRWHSLFHNSLKDDIFYRLTTGQPINPATGMSPGEYRKNNRIVSRSVLRQIQKYLGDVRQPPDQTPSNEYQPGDGSTSPDDNPSKTRRSNRLVLQNAGPPGQTVASEGDDIWQQRMQHVISSGQFKLRGRPNLLDTARQKTVDDFIAATKEGSVETMYELANKQENNDHKKQLLEGKNSSFPWLTALQTAVNENNGMTIDAIKEIADSIDLSLFTKLTLVDESYLPRSDSEGASGGAEVNTMPDTESEIRAFVIKEYNLPSHLPENPGSMARQCSEGRSECAIHKKQLDGVIVLPCCDDKLVCKRILFQSLLEVIPDSIAKPLKSIDCPSCKKPVEIDLLLTRSVERLKSPEAGVEEPTRNSLLATLADIHHKLKERNEFAGQFIELLTEKKTCNVCFYYETCHRFPGCKDDCGTCLGCIDICIRASIRNGLLTEKGIPCPRCNTIIPDYVIQLLKGNDVLKDVTEKAQQISDNKALNTISCPCGHRIDTSLLSEEKVTCSRCSQSLCRKCRKPFHYGKCADEELLEELVKNDPANYKLCPSCRSIINKRDGCNKIMCMNCKNSFCWVCSKNLTGQQYEHFKNYSCVLYGDHDLNKASGVENDKKPDCCQLCDSKIKEQLLCGHTFCSECKKAIKQIRKDVEYLDSDDLGNGPCLLCVNQINKSQESLPVVSLPDDAVLINTRQDRFDLYKCSEGYYCIRKGNPLKEGLFIDKKNCLDPDYINKLRETLGITIRPVTGRRDSLSPPAPPVPPFTVCSVCQGASDSNEEMCTCCLEVMTKSLRDL